jgi:hypothetical protein
MLRAISAMPPWWSSTSRAAGITPPANSAGGSDLRNTVARPGHGGATTLRHYADPVPEVDRRAAAYLSRLERRGWVRPLATEEHRRPYEITAAGQEILAEQVRSMQQIMQVARLRTATAWGA